MMTGGLSLISAICTITLRTMFLYQNHYWTVALAQLLFLSPGALGHRVQIC